MATSKFNCAYSEFFSGARMVTRAAIREITFIGTKKVKYNAAYFSALLAQVGVVEAMPDEDTREAYISILKIKLTEKATAVLNKWQDLKSNIAAAVAFQGELLRPALEAAGQNYYEPAANHDWESVQSLITSAKAFITANSAELLADDNMPPAFSADFDTLALNFNNELNPYQDAIEQARIASSEKLTAANALYDKIIEICKDGQRTFKTDDARRDQFIWNNVLYIIRGAGIAGIRGTVLDLSTQQPVAGATVLIVQTGDTGVPDEEGVYRITGVPAGNYTVRCTAAGYNTLEQPFQVLTGTISTLDFRLTTL